jgi:mono/diheme cytochrome c family protein
VGFTVIAVTVLVREGSIAPWSPNFQPSPLPASVTASLHGAGLFNAKGCHDCHTIAVTSGLRGPDLKSVGSRLSGDELTWRILNGGTNMAHYGATLQPDQL